MTRGEVCLKNCLGFPGAPVVKTLLFQCRMHSYKCAVSLLGGHAHLLVLSAVFSTCEIIKGY